MTKPLGKTLFIRHRHTLLGIPWSRFTGVGNKRSGSVTGLKAYPVTAHVGFFKYSSTKRFLVGSSLRFDERLACDVHTGQRRIFSCPWSSGMPHPWSTALFSFSQQDLRSTC
ncbi:hypothetical protein T492DRAFT_916823 [Pavlovales sp. CCMP2436]|nr:hypothetical protein T492DRAFT_916823 [Pavlovales sp. CCMP2436]